MKNNYINIFSVSLFVLTIIILSLVHMVFGSCQTSRYHYIIQCYYYPKQEYNIIDVPENYTGLWIMWHKNGNLEFSSNRVNGLPHGILKMWHSNGVLKSMGEYNMGKIIGTYFDWDETGKLIKKTHYENGELMKSELLDSKTGKFIVEWERKDEAVR